MKRIMLAFAFMLSACVPEGIPGADRDILSGNEYADTTAGFLQNVDPAYPRPGVTYATADYLYGVQIEYFAADGTSYLWFRGNTKPLRGEWKVQGSSFNPDLCFKYGTNTRDAVTGTRGGNWQCGRVRNGAENVVSFIEGDPFGLSKGKQLATDLRRCELPPPMKLMTRAFKCL